MLCAFVRFYTGTARAARSLLNFHWFPPDCLCESGSQPPSIRKDVKYRARQTRIESGREGGGERRRATPKAGKGQMKRRIKEVRQRRIKRVGDGEGLLDQKWCFESNLKLLNASFS